MAATLPSWVECTFGAASQVDFHARGKNANQKPLKFTVASSSSWTKTFLSCLKPMLLLLSCVLSCLKKSLGLHFWFLIFFPLFRQWDLKDLFRLQGLFSQVEFHIESDSDFLSKSPCPDPLKLSSCTYFNKSSAFLKWVFVEIYLVVGPWLLILFHKLPLWTTLI